MVPLAKGAILAHYRVEEPLGEGGWATVYRAWDMRLERTIALKVLRPDPSPQETGWASLLREARLAAGLVHPHISTIFDAGEEDERAYIAMEYVDGLPLKDLIPEGGFPSEQVIHYGSQITSALAYAHGLGVLHGDIKAANALVTPEGTIKLVDFGFGKRFRFDTIEQASSSHQPLGEMGPLAGTLTHLSPEVLRGKAATVQSDLWALGVLLFEMASGQLPFCGKTGFELGTAILTNQREQLAAEVYPALQTVIDRCLEGEPARRYPSARSVLDDLGAACAPPAKASGRRRLRRMLVPVSLAALALGIFLFLHSGTRLFNPRHESPVYPILPQPQKAPAQNSAERPHVATTQSLPAQPERQARQILPQPRKAPVHNPTSRPQAATTQSLAPQPERQARQILPQPQKVESPMPQPPATSHPKVRVLVKAKAEGRPNKTQRRSKYPALTAIRRLYVVIPTLAQVAASKQTQGVFIKGMLESAVAGSPGPDLGDRLGFVRKEGLKYEKALSHGNCVEIVNDPREADATLVPVLHTGRLGGPSHDIFVCSRSRSLFGCSGGGYELTCARDETGESCIVRPEAVQSFITRSWEFFSVATGQRISSWQMKFFPSVKKVEHALGCK